MQNAKDHKINCEITELTWPISPVLRWMQTTTPNRNWDDPYIIVTWTKCFSFPLSGTVVFCRYSYMIDNIILLITGTLHQRPITELVPKCHPLGSFEEMASINIASTPAELYNAVMIDTPLGENRQCITWLFVCHGKVCVQAKWPIRPELVLVSVAWSD